MLAKVLSCAIVGLDGTVVQVEVDLSSGIPIFAVVGLPDTAIQESRERVRSAVRNSGGYFPNKRVTVNLAPADMRKGGPAYDLPIALGILIASEQVNANVEGMLFLGELSLDGTVRHTDGILPMVAIGQEHGLRKVFVPSVDAGEAALLEGLEVYPVDTLSALADHLNGLKPISPFKPDQGEVAGRGFRVEDEQYDFAFIKGQEHAKRALEIAAAGGHNAIMSGPPGSGKTLLARTMVTILPEMSSAEALEVTKIYSVAGMLPENTPMMRMRPFRSPHHTISNAGLVGGGRFPRPGEITLAHRGILFLDELPEFGQTMLEMLRQPLEDRTLVISRASGSLTFPANFILIGSMNPCPCGYYQNSQKACVCAPSTVTRYQKRLSGPLLDRIDIHLEVPRVEYEKLADNRLGEPSAKIRARVEKAREVQRKRFAGRSVILPPENETDNLKRPAKARQIYTNAEMGPAEVREFCQPDPAATNLLKAATRQMGLSARSYHRVLKLARTIADLAGSEAIQAAHVAEAIQYRRKESN